MRLLPLDLRRLDHLADDATRIDGIPIVHGSLPPGTLLADARTALQAGRAPLWRSPLLFVDESSGRVVGSGIFKGEPDEGWVEIGYGVAESCQRRGHATEAVRRMVELAFAQDEVRAVYAETSVVNVASRRVVEKAAFRLIGERVCAEHGPVHCWLVEAA